MEIKPIYDEATQSKLDEINESITFIGCSALTAINNLPDSVESMRVRRQIAEDAICRIRILELCEERVILRSVPKYLVTDINLKE